MRLAYKYIHVYVINIYILFVFKDVFNVYHVNM